VSGHHGRSEWFGTACCPSNIARLVASIGSYIYVVSDRDIWVNLFIGNTTKVTMGKDEISLNLTTEYPWEGKVKLAVDPPRRMRYALRMRMPGWVKGQAVPGDLYRFSTTASGGARILVNGQPVEYKEENGYAVLDREWNKGDVVELQLPMEIRTVVARNEVAEDRNRIALQRGPLVYCVEGADNTTNAWDLVVPEKTQFKAEHYHVLDEPVIAIKGEVPMLVPSSDGLGVQMKRQPVTAIPYYTWANRENYEMQVWLPTKIQDLKINV
jgi:DUF1680 family protein